jgi:hypothetical protein
MNRPGMPDKLNLMEASRVCGIHYSTAHRLFHAGEFPGTKHPYTRLIEMTRAELILWMAKNNYPPELYRHKLQPRNGHLFAVGVPRPARFELTGCNPTFLPSMLSLGLRLATDPCWGVMFGFTGIGRDRAFEAAGELREMRDCPLLIAVAGEDEAIRLGDPTKIFDQTYTEPINYLKLAEAMRRLYKGVVRAWPRIADPDAGRFRRVGDKVK